MGRPTFTETDRKNLLLGLGGFEASKSDGLLLFSEAEVLPIERTVLPVPGLTAVLLEEMVGAKTRHRPEEKVHWAIPFAYKGIDCSLSLEKFGVRLRIADGAQFPAKEVMYRLQKATRRAERSVFSKYVASQTQAGNVTVENKSGLFSSMYAFFRDKATATLDAEPQTGKAAFNLAGIMNANFERKAEGLYYGLSMLDAYFSWLEHVLVLLLPFSGYDRTVDDLVAFIGARWGEKYKRVVGLDAQEAHTHYDRLTERNTYAHGGFEKKGASLRVHLDGFSPIPASMTRTVESPFFRMFPLEAADLKEVVNVLDQFDGFLQRRFPSGMEYVGSGLPVVFDEDGLNLLLEHADDPEAFRSWLEGFTQYVDMMENGDL